MDEFIKMRPKTPGTKLSTEQYVKDLSLICPDWELLEDYKNVETKILHRCKLCGREKQMRPHHVYQKKGIICECIKKETMHKGYVEKIKNINPDIEIRGKFTGNKNRVEVQCKICEHIWNPYANTLTQNHGCPICGRKRTYAEEKYFWKRAKENLPDVEILTPYTKAGATYHCRCLVCNYEWDITGSAIIRGKTGCRNCYRINKTLTNEEFLERFNKVHSTIEPLDSYISATTYMKFRCKICDNIWDAIPNSINSGTGCPSCCKPIGERKVEKYFKDNSIAFIPQKTFSDLLGIGNGLLSYDFYLPQYNLLIEFQGEQHEHPIEFFGGEEKFIQQQEHDKRKREYAEQHNINMLEIWYYDIDNIENILNETIKNLKYESVETAISA